jgi:hypothetical protein
VTSPIPAVAPVIMHVLPCIEVLDGCIALVSWDVIPVSFGRNQNDIFTTPVGIPPNQGVIRLL